MNSGSVVLSWASMAGETSRCSSLFESKVQLVSSCKPEKISYLFSFFDTQKANLVKACGFGGLLRLQPFTLNLDLCLWLLQFFDYNNECLHLPGGVDLPCRIKDVDIVFGIPSQGHPVHCNHIQNLKTISVFTAKLCCSTNSPTLTLSFLEHILTRDYGSHMTPNEEEAFSIATVLYAVAYLLAPEPNNKFPLELIQNFTEDVKPSQINWSSLVFWTLHRASINARENLNKGCKQLALYGCCLFLQVFYIDNLNFGPPAPDHSLLPRSSAYLPEFMSAIIISDCIGKSTQNLMLFGKTELRPVHEVCYTRFWMHQLEQLARADDITFTDFIKSGTNLLEKFAVQSSEPTQSLDGQHKVDKKRKSNFSFTSTYNYGIDYIPMPRPSSSGKTLCNGILNQLISKKALCSGDPVDIGIERPVVKRMLSTVPFQATETQIAGGILNQPISKRDESSADILDIGIEEPRVKRLISSVSDQEEQKQTAGDKDITTCPNFIMGNSSKFDMVQGFTSSIEMPCSRRKTSTKHPILQDSFSEGIFEHPTVLSESKYICYQWMINKEMPWNEANSPWIVFNSPQSLNIPGNIVRRCLKLNGAFTVAFVDAIMVLWSLLDGMMLEYYNAQGKPHSIWRHFLPASFVELVNGNSDFLKCDLVREAFIGNHINYNVKDCQEIIVPVLANDHTWSCYIWDFKTKNISILDPVLQKCHDDKVREKHHDTVFNLHTALFACKDHFFSGWQVSANGWNAVFLTNLSHKCSQENSGLYAVHYARTFRGTTGLSCPITKANERNLLYARGEILYNFVTCPHNKGYKSVSLKEKIHFIDM